MKHYNLNSSNIKSAAYDTDTKVLEVMFHAHERVYRYLNVPGGVFECLLAAEQPGQYFQKAIKGKYTYRLVDHEDAG